ncbi:MAG: sigma-70 family RNA polymerase sigma factor [Bacteroidales bacterium]|nr:sigma-70 family RNA polymerase sigma factor [Candidatus Equimonas faecalis]
MDTNKKFTDLELVTRYAEGDDSAFDVLLYRYKDKLYSYIYYLVNDEDRANDIFQETFVKVIMTIRQGRYTESGRFYAWLTRIAHNLAIDEFRDTMNTSTLSDEETNGTLFNSVQLSTEAADGEQVDEQTLRNVKELMERLPSEQREVVFMRIYQGLSFKEIADETGVGLNTALGRMHYALINMRRMATAANVFTD